MTNNTPPNGASDIKRTIWFIVCVAAVIGFVYGCNKYHENQLHKQQPNPPGVTEG